MPEMPEVETIRRDLAEWIKGRTIAGVDVRDLRALQGFSPSGKPRRNIQSDPFAARLTGSTITDVLRRGKYLIFPLSDGKSLLCHLRMTGRLVIGPALLGARVVLSFNNTRDVLSFSDTRRFGEMWIADDWRKDSSIAALGPEPLEGNIDAEAWGNSFRRSSSKIQAALLDQKRIAGLGNIYVTEALFRTGIRPTRRCDRVKPGEIPPLLRHIRDVLSEGVAHRGVSFRDYRDARGEKGRAKERLLVYGKENQPCPRCESSLKGTKVNGRGTVYCPFCQK